MLEIYYVILQVVLIKINFIVSSIFILLIVHLEVTLLIGEIITGEKIVSQCFTIQLNSSFYVYIFILQDIIIIICYECFLYHYHIHCILYVIVIIAPSIGSANSRNILISAVVWFAYNNTSYFIISNFTLLYYKFLL